mgnify:CR=1 FL=1
MIRLNLTTFYRYSLVLYLFVISINIFLYIFFQVSEISLVGPNSGNDANVYHKVAIREYSRAINIWPEILRFLNDYGLYNRDYIKYTIYLLYLFVIPFLLYKSICNAIGIKRNKHIYRFISIYMCLYPGLLLLTFDIYRDIFMLTLYSIFIYISSFIFNGNISLIRKISFWIILLALSYVMFQARRYLGISVFLGLLLYKLPINKINIIILTIGYFSMLLIFRESGLIDPLLDYRGQNGFTVGDSTLGIGLINKHGFEFISYFIISSLAQFFNLYITSIRSLIVFLVEAIPIFFMLCYIYKNRLISNEYIKFFIIFLIIYTSFWVIGNDNVGTAIRLRIFSYFSIFLPFTFILFYKKNSQ